MKGTLRVAETDGRLKKKEHKYKVRIVFNDYDF